MKISCSAARSSLFFSTQFNSRFYVVNYKSALKCNINQDFKKIVTFDSEKDELLSPTCM